MDYAVDANVFIEAHRRYYRFGLCPGFWQSFIHHHTQGQIYSIDRIKAELIAKTDALAQWVTNTVPAACFEASDTAPIIAQYQQLLAWVNAQAQFKPAAKHEFAQKADAWLIAYAKTTGKILVTHEVLDPEAKKRVPIPNVCEAFDIVTADTFDMLEALGTTYHWNQPPPAGAGA